MEEHLRQVFIISKTIGPQIAQGRFYILGPDGDIILPQFWDMLVEPDWNVTLEMWAPESPERENVDITWETISTPNSESGTNPEAVSEEPQEITETIPEEVLAETSIAVESNSGPIVDEIHDEIGNDGAITRHSEAISGSTPDAVSEEKSDISQDKTPEAGSEPVPTQESIPDVRSSELADKQVDKTPRDYLSQYAPKLAGFAGWSKRKLKKHSHLVRGPRFDAKTWAKIS